ncbi:hypothetical protein [Nocardia macrotermitis]|uniref:Uncharacterized protein n=1 Tax=Nocardia macrotermitis TaxID=2585198 RepID=A0A7K0CYI5_9NOCA|nr:hypothetical protein [Nocardia macrotermitis]MQY18545.1 hypothetical protein [Nocardia macrotermitis]
MFGLSPEWLLYNGRPVASALVLAHEAELARLATLTPAAAHIGVVAGDPAYDRMLASAHLRMHYREALHVAPARKLITVCTTWSQRSLLGTWPQLFRELAACLPRDEYRIVGVVHPNTWHGHGAWQVKSWLADARRAGLTLIGPTEGWQAVLLASDLIVGDFGATTCYGAAVGIPTLLAGFSDADVAPDSVGELLGRLAPRINRYESLRTQLDKALEDDRAAEDTRSEKNAPPRYAPIAELMSSCPGESIERLRALCYRHLKLPVPQAKPVTAIIPPELVAIPTPDVLADLVVCTTTSRGRYTVSRYPAAIEIDRSTADYLDDAFLVVHENHPQQALLRESPVVLGTAPAAGQSLDDILTAILRRLPAARVVAVPADNETIIVRIRDDRRIILSGNDTGLAAALVYEWLLTGGGELPPELIADTGADRVVFSLRGSAPA